MSPWSFAFTAKTAAAAPPLSPFEMESEGHRADGAAQGELYAPGALAEGRATVPGIHPLHVLHIHTLRTHTHKTPMWCADEIRKSTELKALSFQFLTNCRVQWPILKESKHTPYKGDQG